MWVGLEGSGDPFLHDLSLLMVFFWRGGSEQGFPCFRPYLSFRIMQDTVLGGVVVRNWLMWESRRVRRYMGAWIGWASGDVGW